MGITGGKWKVKTGQFQTGASYYLNRIRVAGYQWNTARAQGEEHSGNIWAGEVALPSLKNAYVVAGSEKEIKEKIERIVAGWFKEALAKAEGK